ncbi:MAG: ATP-binding cassette domain-containing protein [Proteobacteria bacterium]|nr:ATP-binding cassette domain-containing protein [Pseudomonadota bacterium]
MLKKLLYLLDRQARREAGVLGVMMVMGAGLEAVGVGLVFPFVAVLSQPAIVSGEGTIGQVYSSLGFESQRSFAIVGMVTLLGLFVLKNIFLVRLSYAQYAFAYRSQVRLSRRLYERYLRSPYSFHLRRNSAELLRNVNSEALWIFNHVVVPVLIAATEALVLLGILLVLFAAAPRVTLGAMAVLGGASGGFYVLIRGRSQALGRRQQKHMGRMIQWVNQGLGSFKSTRVTGREEYFLKAYSESSNEYAEANIWLKTVAALPRLVLEVLGVSALLGAGIIVLFRQRDFVALIPYIGLFGVAAARLMPSLNRIMTSLAGIRFFAASVDAVYGDLVEDLHDATLASTRADEHAEPLDMTESLELRDLRFRYEGADQPALDGISLTIPRGSVVGVIGTSGAGKSTLVDVLLGLLEPQGGAVLVDGVDIAHHRARWLRSVEYIPQTTYLLDDTIRSNVAFAQSGDEIDNDRLKNAIGLAQLAPLIKELEGGLDTEVGEDGVRLSGGQKQRIAIARSLYRDPSVLVFDEATASLDAETERDLLDEVFSLRGQKTLIIVAHRLATLKPCDQIVILAGGKIAGAGTFEELVQRDGHFRTLLHEI